MKTQSEIDATLRLLGSAQPPSGLERRVLGRLDARRGGGTTLHFVSAAAIAASVALVAAGLTPSIRELAFHGTVTAPRALAPRAVPHPAGGFGAASAVHLPAAPIPVQPTPVSQGRGRARSDREWTPGSARVRLPHGVAVPGTVTISQSHPGRMQTHLVTIPAGSHARSTDAVAAH